MASLETFGFDDEFPDSFSLNCPNCEKEIEISLDRDSNSITCPHCQCLFEIESL